MRCNAIDKLVIVGSCSLSLEAWVVGSTFDRRGEK